MVSVKYLSQVKDITRRPGEEIEATTLKELVSKLVKTYPRLKDKLFHKKVEFRYNVSVDGKIADVMKIKEDIKLNNDSIVVIYQMAYGG